MDGWVMDEGCSLLEE